MRFLADENIFPKIIDHLQNLGHDVKSIMEFGLAQATDDKVIDIAISQDRTIITFDKHFGNILRYPPRSLPGIILIRIHPPLLNDIFSALDNLFKHYSLDSFKGKLIVLTTSGYRIR